MSVFRAYFYDAVTKQELDHPSSGKSWLGTSGNVYRDEEFVAGTCVRVSVADWATLRSVENEVVLTADDFDRPVLVKIWYGPDSVEWRVLMRDEDPVDHALVEWCLASSTR